jgi:DNA mismatch repair protein MutL
MDEDLRRKAARPAKMGVDLENLLSPGRVRLLDSHTVNQIAAGEVVERPGSVVKELVENALDAGATRIEIELIDAGRTLIRVSDDGIGMSDADALAALQRHATSKISSSEDLLGVRTLGFRGEALPSIASVSRFSLRTSTTDGSRIELGVSGAIVAPATRVSGPRGTELVVRDLFYNTPARLKFLKSDTTELGQTLDHISRYAIAYPHVAFTLTHNGQTAIRTNGDGEMQGAIAEVWSRDLARTLAPIYQELSGMVLRGFVSPPHVTKPTRAFQYVYVNGRPVRTRTLTAAIDVAFRDITPDRRYPLLVLMIEIDADRIDVNVSPTKSEVKFQQEGLAFDAIRISLKSALMEHGMMPSAAQIATVNEALRQVHESPSTPERPPQPVLEDFRPPEAPEQTSDVVWEPEVFGTPLRPPVTGPQPFASLLEGLHVIGQVMNTFIIAETKSGVVIIDQHVAHERIIYEYLCGLKGPTAIERQPLLVPQTLHLDRRSTVLLRERLEELVNVGFDIEPFGGESYVVRGVPAAIRQKDPLKILRDLVDELVENTVTRRLVPTREQIWITSSCKMAVKAGDPLSLVEMEKLILDLAETENPYLCPHGRPITATLGRDAILRLFKRI